MKHHTGITPKQYKNILQINAKLYNQHSQLKYCNTFHYFSPQNCIAF